MGEGGPGRGHLSHTDTFLVFFLFLLLVVVGGGGWGGEAGYVCLFRKYLSLFISKVPSHMQ